jgi:hypothetical protein
VRANARALKAAASRSTPNFFGKKKALKMSAFELDM